MIYEHFRATGAYEAVQCLSDLLKKRLHNDDVQDLDTRWDQALLSAIEIPTELILDGFYKSKLQESVQLQPALAMCEQENLGALFVPLFLSALKAAATDTLMRDVDVDIDSPCSSSWQSFEVLLEVHCSRGGDDFFCKCSRPLFWKSECQECLRKLRRNQGSRESLCFQSLVQHFAFSRVLGVS